MGACVALLLSWLVAAWSRGPLEFDDAYMFYRYALHVRDGLGVAWNPDGVQTYGLTSHLWLLVVLPFTLLPLDAGVALQLASTCAAAAAFATMGSAIARHATSQILSNRWLAIASVGLPLLLAPAFIDNLTTGMDTMLSLLMNAGIVGAVLAYTRAPSLRRAGSVGIIAFAAVLTRPENGLCALGVPFLVFLQMRGGETAVGRRWTDLAGLIALPAVLMALELVVCARVFGVPLPLSFYAKSLHAYANFQNTENPFTYLLVGLACALPFLAVLPAVTPRRRLVWLAAFVLPVLATAAYLLTVRQIMGWSGRYYLPFLPYVVVPALLLLDEALARQVDFRPLARRVGVIFAALVLAAVVTRPLQRRVAGAVMARVLKPSAAVPPLPIRAAKPLPDLPWFEVIQQLADEIVRPLPRGATIAASEVGRIGSVAPAVSVIDLVGLNDTTIGTHGFSMDYLLRREPDLIWFPHEDYTGLRAQIFSDPRLFERYIVIAGAFNYGIAIRRDGQHRAMIERNLAGAWGKLYPGVAMTDYLVEPRPAP
jgi:hypothetical protein